MLRLYRWGMKVIRIILILKQGMREVMRLIHPNAVIAVKVGKVSVPDSIAQAVWGFFSAYDAVPLMLVGVMATGVDQVTAWSSVGSALNNLGPRREPAATWRSPSLAKWFSACHAAGPLVYGTGAVYPGFLAPLNAHHCSFLLRLFNESR